MSLLWRRVSRNFGISAPRMAVRTHLPWWGRGAVILTLLAIIGGMWWWGFDFGQIFGGFNRREIETKLVTLESEARKLRSEAGDLRTRNSTLESELAMTRGSQETQQKQSIELASENAQLKEELAFLQKLVSDSSKQVGLQLQRLSVERDSEEMWHYSLLVVRGGSPKDEFEGSVVLQATLAPAVGAAEPLAPSHGVILTLPDDQPEAKSALILKFKYYQRVEGRFRVPAGMRVTAVTARAFESGQQSARATRTLQL
jgi:hypothetical protein